MAEAEYSTTAKLPVGTIWEFVKDMDNWAHFVRGYQSHEKQSEDDSVWTLKGDVGVMARILEFKVHVSEWAGPGRVTFELEGVNELMQGGGEFLMEAYEEGEAAVAAETAPRRNPFLRLLEAIVRFFLRLFGGARQERRAPTAGAGPGQGMARLTFRLRIDPGGPMAPMVNAMMKPVLLPAAEELANKIMAHLESQRA